MAYQAVAGRGESGKTAASGHGSTVTGRDGVANRLWTGRGEAGGGW